MRAFARILFVYTPLFVVLLIQAAALLTLYGGKFSGKDDTMIDPGTHVPALRFGWPVIFVVAVVFISVREPEEYVSRVSLYGAIAFISLAAIFLWILYKSQRGRT